MIYGHYYDYVDNDWEFSPFDCYDWVDPTKYRLNHHGVLVHAQGRRKGDALTVYPSEHSENPYFIVTKDGKPHKLYAEEIVQDQAKYNYKIGRKWAYYVT